MNQKELNEIKRRLNPEKTSVGKIYGCFINTAKNVIAEIDRTVGLMTEIEREQYMSILKGTLAGKLGKNLLAIPFSASDAEHSEPYKLLAQLRRTSLEDAEVRGKLYAVIAESFAFEDANTLILLADDVYDVPKRGHNADDDSDSVFHYILCAVCPVRDGKTELAYDAKDRDFHPSASLQNVAPPVVGFMYPAFDGRAANIYSAVYFTRNAGEIHEDFVGAVFGCEAPMSSAEQKDAFCEVLAETLKDDCSFRLVQAVHGELRERLEAHRESRDPEILEITPDEVCEILTREGVEEKKVEAFRRECTEKFDGDTLVPANLIAQNQFQLRTPDAKITVAPEAAVQVETRVIDGRKYILIPAEEDVELNGMNVRIG